MHGSNAKKEIIPMRIYDFIYSEEFYYSLFCSNAIYSDDKFLCYIFRHCQKIKFKLYIDWKSYIGN